MTATTDPQPAGQPPAQANAVAFGEVARRAVAIADAAVIADIQSEGHKVDRQGATWWDTRPMLNPHEHAPQVIDIAEQALAYGRMRGLIEHHPSQPHLVRLNARR